MTKPNEPGWLDDPNDANAQRWWDGENWTPQRRRRPASFSAPARPAVIHTAPMPVPPPPPPATYLPPPAAPLPPPPGPQAAWAPSPAASASYSQPSYPSQPGAFAGAIPAAGGDPAPKNGPSVRSTNALALYSLVSGIVAIPLDFLCGAGIIASILSITVGLIALKKSKQLNGTGRGMAISGIVIASLAIVLWIIGFFVFGAFMTDGLNPNPVK